MKIRVEGQCATIVSEVEETLRGLGYDPVPAMGDTAALRAFVSVGDTSLPPAGDGEGPLLLIIDRDDPSLIQKLLLAGVSDWLLWPRDRHLLGERLSVLRRRLGSDAILAAGLAHEINNPLTWVLANLEHLHTRIDPDDPILAPPIRDALQGLEQIRAILQGVRAYTQRGEGAIEAVEVRPLLESALRILGERLHPVVTLHCSWDSLPRVLANQAQLRQVLLNLLTNALQALPDRPREENRIEVAGRPHPEGAAIEIRDNGVGIDPRILPRIFDAFFTTKKASQGTGLGLSISVRMVMAMGGRIEVESQPGSGTTFRVILQTGAPALPAEAHGSGRCRLLLLEDEPLVVSLMQRLLADRYDIEATSDATEALSWLESGRRFDVILSDMMLPGMKGMEFFQRLEDEHPSLAPRTGFITGGTFSDETTRFLHLHRDRVLEKPFTASALKSFVRSLEEA